MISMTYRNKQLYERMMSSYLDGSITAAELVLRFFDQRRLDVEADYVALNGLEWSPSTESNLWELVFSMLFNACEDVDLIDEEGPGAPHWIDENEFRRQITLILPDFLAFELRPHVSAS
jgi:hypothetical protein